MQKDPIRFRLQVLLIVFFTIILLGTVGFMLTENLSIQDAFYFNIVTITTVGYGDIHPTTSAGKFLSIIMIVLGVGTFLGVVANVTEMILNKREKKARLEKLNMVIGTFFSEVGTKLLEEFSTLDQQIEKNSKNLAITNEWSEQDFLHVSGMFYRYDSTLDAQNYDLEYLRSFLLMKRDFLLRLLENPMLLEHESFTDLLRAVFHLTEELAYREDVKQLPATDKTHLTGDIKRSYDLLVQHWLQYMKYLKDRYPYLFSLALRTNPFDKKASPIVR